MKDTSDHITWNSGWTFCLVLAGVTVGMQLVWTLPAQLMLHTGSGFLVVYCLALIVFAAPLLAGEIWLGREGRNNPIHTINLLQVRTGVSPFWRLLGPLSVLVSILVLSYLALVGGWSIAFGLDVADEQLMTREAEALVQHLHSFLSDSNRIVQSLSLFLLLLVFLSAMGVRRGLGFTLRLVLPLAALILLVLIAHNVSIGALGVPRWNAALLENMLINWESAWAAVALAFFTASVGMGAVIAVAAHMPEGQSIGRAVSGVVLITAFFAVLIGFAVLPILTHSNVEVTEGAPMVLLNLPLAYGSTVHGDYYGALFFVLILLISLSSALVLLEPITAWFQSAFIVPRYVAALLGGAIVWLLAVAVGLSFNEWADADFPGGFSPFNLVESATAYILIPVVVILNGLLISALLRSPFYGGRYTRRWRWLSSSYLAYLCPALVLGVVWYAAQNILLF